MPRGAKIVKWINKSSDGTKCLWDKTNWKTQNKIERLRPKGCGITRRKHELERKLWIEKNGGSGVKFDDPESLLIKKELIV